MAAKQPNKDNLSTEQIKFFDEIFHDYDKDNDGRITSKELGILLRSLGMVLTELELVDLINEVDRDGNGFIDTDEFRMMMAKKMKEVEDIEDGGEGVLRETFRIFDKDSDGFITVPELRLVMRNLGEKMSREDVQCMIDALDTDEDGRISYKEFKQFMRTYGHK